MDHKVAICILTLDEDINILGCIKSLVGFSDVHVLDSGSSDKTLELARSLNVKTYVNQQVGRYSAAIQRNWAMDHLDTDADWIFFVDADEHLSEDFYSNLQICIDKNKHCSVISVPLIYHLHGKMIKSMGYPNWHDRIIKRGEKFTSAVGEYIDTDLRSKDIKLKLIHYFNSHGMRRFMEKQTRYAEFIGKSTYQQLTNKKDGDYFNKPGLKGVMKRAVARLGFFRPFLRFGYQYFFRLGFLEGRAGFIVSFYMGMFEFLVVVAQIEEGLKNQNKIL